MDLPQSRHRAAASLQAAAFTLASLGLLGSASAQAQQAGYGQTLGTTPQERQIYGTGSSGAGGAPIDAKNPLDLINQLRRSSAMDDATPPSTAVDKALRELETTAVPSRSASPAAGAPLKGP